MKITKTQLRQIIKEEIKKQKNSIKESHWEDMTSPYGQYYDPERDRREHQEREAQRQREVQAAQATQEAQASLNKIKQEINDLKGHMKDPDFQSPEAQAELKQLLNDAIAKFPTVQKLAQEIQNLEQQLGTATGKAKFDTQKSIKTKQAEKQAEIDKIIAGIEQGEQDFVKESLKRHFRKEKQKFGGAR